MKPEKFKMPKIEDKWKKKLTGEQYRVLRQKGTEPAFTGKYWNTKEKGIFHCAGCGQKIFSSDTKFDSGTGWPSFTDEISGSVKLNDDFSHGRHRVEVTCSKCGGHFGHLFDDGPKDKGEKDFALIHALWR